MRTYAKVFGMRTKILFSCLLFVFFATSAYAQEFESFEFDGSTRTYIVNLPENYDESQSAPVIIALHGAGDNGRNLQTFTQIDNLASRNGYISVFPDGLNRGWFYLDEEDTVTPRYTDDLGFLEALIDQLDAEFAIDTSRVYLVGFSNGALLSLRAACDLSDTIAGVIAIGATYAFEITKHCNGEHVTPTMLVWGSDDELFPQNGFVVYAEEITGTRTSFSVTQTRTYMLTRHQCDDFEANQVQLEDSDYGVIRIVFLRCDTPAILYLIGDLGHEYPRDIEIKFLNNRTTGTMEEAFFDFFTAVQVSKPQEQ